MNDTMSSQITFCKVCDNMLYDTLNDSKQYVKYCKNCSFTELATSDNASRCISTVKYNNDTVNFDTSNPYLKYDNTLPRIRDLPCPNSACTKDANDNNNVMFIKYDPKNLKFLYICSYCNASWTSIDVDKNGTTEKKSP